MTVPTSLACSLKGNASDTHLAHKQQSTSGIKSADTIIQKAEKQSPKIHLSGQEPAEMIASSLSDEKGFPDHLASAKEAYDKICKHNAIQGSAEQTTETILHSSSTDLPLSIEQESAAKAAILHHQAELYKHIELFQEWMNRNGLSSTKVSGENSNCLINALLQHVTGQYFREGFEEATSIRDQINKEFPDLSLMLYDDEKRTMKILEIINKTHEANLYICFIQANCDGLPCITSQIGNSNNNPVVIWNQGGHYVSLTTQEYFSKASSLHKSSYLGKGLPCQTSEEKAIFQPTTNSHREKSYLDRKTSFTGNRDTRSDVFCTGIMQVVDFDTHTGEITAKFLFQEDIEKFNQCLADCMISQGFYAAAKHFTSNERNDVSSLEWISKAQKITSDLILQEKSKEWSEKNDTLESEAAELSAKAEEASLLMKDKYKNFTGIITDIRKKFPKIDLFILFEQLKAAKVLHPKAFTPHYFLLCLITALLKDNTTEKLAEKIVEEAYQLCPVRTFNVLLTHFEFLISRDTDQTLLKAFINLFLKNFSEDIVGLLVIEHPAEKKGILSSQNIERRKSALFEAFSTNLGLALTAVRKRAFKDARKLFLNAGNYHTSDKRPYMYMALIDTHLRDIPSAIKLCIRLSNSVNWLDYNEKKLAMAYLSETVTNPEFDKKTPREYPETPVIQALIKLCHSENSQLEFSEKFFDAMRFYLSHVQADIVWASFAIDIAIDRLGDITDCMEDSKKMKFLLDYNCLLISCIFFRLENMGQDIAKYNDLLKTENKKLYANINFLITYPQAEQRNVSISPNSLQIEDSLKVIIFDELLWERYNHFCLLFFQMCSLIGVVNFLKQSFSTETTFYGPFIGAFIQRINTEGTLKQKIELLQWSLNHIKMFTPSSLQVLTNCALCWQLDPIFYPETDRLVAMNARWLEVTNSAAQKNSLRTAFDAWTYIKKKEWDKANKTITPFFDSWGKNLFEGIDFITLRTLCLVKALLKKRKIAQEMPCIAKSLPHGELIRCALSILARNGTMKPYVIPDAEISKETLKDLCLLYLGQQLDENDEDFSHRLENAHLPNLSDLRQTQHFHDPFSQQPTDNEWVAPFLRSDLIKQMNNLIEEKIKFQEDRLKKNEEIKQERPEYSNNPTFIGWVTHDDKLVNKYLNDSKKLKQELNRACPDLPLHVEEAFFEELKEKSNHEKTFRELKKKTAKAQACAGKRFWQLVEQTSEIINEVYTNTRSEGYYDKVFSNENEAHFVMKLIYEWSKSKSKDYSEKLTEAFHGPEIHVWGKGPRIKHFNAGVFFNKNFVNVHLFFE